MMERQTAAEAPRGQLKIFFGYAAGAGKTYAMLQAAHAAQARGVDVVSGCIEPHARPQTARLAAGLEQLPPLCVRQDGLIRREFDLDAALRRSPQLILVDELAHTNAAGCRHAKRYQDIEELLKHGIDVYTTVNVQHIESLNDQVAAVTGVQERERIPDAVLDGADQVELVDIEPQELIDRLSAGHICHELQAQRAAENFFTAEKLTALREIALRRCADRVCQRTVRSGRSGYYTDEHILVCLSPAPSNPRIIRTAARMAAAFRAAFTALYVESPSQAPAGEADRQRLRDNTRLAQQLGATIETVYGDDIPQQIAEFARLSGATKIVIGRSAASRRFFFGKPTLTEQLIALAPSLEIHVIPDQKTPAAQYRTARKAHRRIFSAADLLKSIGILLAASGIGLLFDRLGLTEVNMVTVYILGVLVTAVVTGHQIYSLMSAFISVNVYNFLFTEPRYTLAAYDSSYPVTFLVMFFAALITGNLAVRLKNSARQSAQAAFRTNLLFETNQLLQKEQEREAFAAVAAGQLVKLLERDVVVYLVEDGALGAAHCYPAASGPCDCCTEEERAVAQWVMQNNKHAGATTDTFSGAKCLYLAIRVRDTVYGVVGIAVGAEPLDAFENSILLSILGECALAMENEQNRREKEEAAVLAKNEQLRADLLRAISHDLRTPLTAISGNASNLLRGGDAFAPDVKRQMCADIYDDAMWLMNLVENLLSVTRLDDGRMRLQRTAELLSDVIAEALRHTGRERASHPVAVEQEDELLLVRVDARLIVQVVINIVDNAFKYTPDGTGITIRTFRRGGMAVVAIADEGPGIPDAAKAHVFDMFYTGAKHVADSRRSLGLGLALCRSIVTAHGGTITVADNVPRGTVFTFTLPIGEVHLHE